MSDRCPGGNHSKHQGDICCESCWDRLPNKLGGRPWRRARQQASSFHRWEALEGYNRLIRGWLVENPQGTHRCTDDVPATCSRESCDRDVDPTLDPDLCPGHRQQAENVPSGGQR